jgi:O-antigen/teichoic acid export membrane protein
MENNKNAFSSNSLPDVRSKIQPIGLIASTTAKELISTISNILIALVLAHQFQPSKFLIYTSVIFIVSSAIQINRGVQFAVVNTRNFHQNEHSKFEFSLPKIALFELVVWIILSPLIAYFFKLPTIPLVVAGLALPITITSSWVSGMMQSNQRFGEWQTWLTVTTLLQFPLIATGIYFKLSLSLFIFFAFFATLISSSFYVIQARRLFFRSKISLHHFLGTGLFSAVLFLNYNLPILTIRNNVAEEDLGKYAVLTFPFGILVGMSSIFGSFLLSSSMRSYAHNPTKYRFEWKQFLLVLFLMLTCGLMIKHIAPALIPRTIGDKYGTDFSNSEIMVCVLAYSCWAFIYWLSQSQMHRIGRLTIFFQLIILVIELFMFLFLELSPLGVFLTHLMLGLVGLILFISSMNQLIPQRIRPFRRTTDK